MVFENLCVLVLWKKISPAFEGFGITHGDSHFFITVYECSIVVIVYLCTNSNPKYTSSSRCRLPPYTLYFVFLVPMGIIIIFNLAIFILVVRVLVGRGKNAPTGTHDKGRCHSSSLLHVFVEFIIIFISAKRMCFCFLTTHTHTHTHTQFHKNIL